MTDITKALRELPPLTKSVFESGSLGASITHERDALRARLAIAERRYAELADTLTVHVETTCCAVTRQRVAEVLAYLAHRAKEQ